MTLSAHTCPQCHAPIEVGQKFCKTCGLSLDPASLAAFYARQPTQPVNVAPVHPPPGYYSVAPVYTPPMAPARRGFPRWLLFGVGGLLGLCMVCGLIGALFNPRNAAPAVASTVVVRQVADVATSVPATLVPTSAPPPSPTQAPPTAVPTEPPTAMPTEPPATEPPTQAPPTATNAPAADTGMTAAEQAYILAVGDQSTRFGQELNDLSDEMVNADLADTDWIIRTAVTVTSMNAIIDEAQKLHPPASLRALDTSYQKAMVHFRKSTTALAQGITDAQNGQLDTASPLLTQASTELTAGSTEIQTTGQLLNDFIAAHK